MASLLDKYYNREAAIYLLEGLSIDFRILALPPSAPFWEKNLKSVVGIEEVVRNKILKEVKAGRVVGSFKELPPPISFLVGSCAQGGPHRILPHTSFILSKGESVNDGIPSHLCSVRYTSLDEAIRILCSCGAGTLMAKAGIEPLPVHSDDFCLLGLWFEGGYYVDRALPMGCSILYSAFEQCSTFLEWAIRAQVSLKSTTHYFDDFLFMGKASTDQCD